MGLASLSYDAVPSQTLTPQEPLVESLRIALSSNATFVLTQPQDKTFLVTWVVKEYARHVRNQTGSVLIVVADHAQALLWSQFFCCSMDLTPALGLASVEKPTFLITTTMELQALKPEEFKIKFQTLNPVLVMIDNAHALFEDVPHLEEALKHHSCRIVAFTANLLSDNNDSSLRRLSDELSTLQNFYPTKVEACCELMTQLRFIVDPTITIVKFPPPPDADKLEKRLESMADRCIDFLQDHVYELFAIYGAEYQDLISEIPDPIAEPLAMLSDFKDVLKSFGIWCAERAALVLAVRIDKLKTREKYERHYLILSFLYSEMLKIHKICEEFFGDLPEKDKIVKYSKPKLKRLMEVLRQYKPEHVGSYRSHSRSKNVEIKKSEPVPEIEEDDKQEDAEENDTTRTDVKEESDPQKSEKDSKDSGRPFRRHYPRSKSAYSSYDDPNALCGAIFVGSKFTARILYHFIKDLSRTDVEYSFLTPQYAVGDLRDDTAEDESDKRKQEEALRKFRMRECNILISESTLEVGVDNVRCNLVISFEVPRTFKTYIQYKVKAKSPQSWYLIFCQDDADLGQLMDKLALYQVFEDKLKELCTFQGPSRINLSADHFQLLGFQTSTSCPPIALKDSILLLNRYCAKLPSDTL